MMIKGTNNERIKRKKSLDQTVAEGEEQMPQVRRHMVKDQSSRRPRSFGKRSRTRGGRRNVGGMARLPDEKCDSVSSINKYAENKVKVSFFSLPSAEA